MPGQNKTYYQDESGNYGKTIWQYRWPRCVYIIILDENYDRPCRVIDFYYIALLY